MSGDMVWTVVMWVCLAYAAYAFVRALLLTPHAAWIAAKLRERQGRRTRLNDRHTLWLYLTGRWGR